MVAKGLNQIFYDLFQHFGWKKFGLLAAERAVVDPAGEAYGEYLAQILGYPSKFLAFCL